MEEIDFNLDDNSFTNFLSARYSVSSRIMIEK